MSTAETDNQDVALTDVMLAMDVVDTLRHEERMVAQALNAEAREQQLIERVRRAYASQGIAVTDAMIEQGVASLKAREFHYEPPQEGLRTRLATAWVNRARIGTGLGFFGGLAAIIGLGWYGLVVWPEVAERREQAAALNQSIVLARTDTDLAKQRLASVQRSFTAVDDSTITNATRAAFDNTSAAVMRALANAEQSIEDAVTSNAQPSLDADNVTARATGLQQTLSRQRAALNAADASLNIAEDGVATLQTLGALRAELQLLRDEALTLATDSAIDARIDADYRAASAALAAGDSTTASNGAQSLRDMIATLRSEFSVRIVSRPGVASGIIREPPNNRSASNFYLIVESQDGNGNFVPVDITSEEDGSRRSVSRWGIRVDASTFERVRKDKSDDGIIQDANAGRKTRGALGIEYAIPTSGGTIHTWEEPR